MSYKQLIITILILVLALQLYHEVSHEGHIGDCQIQTTNYTGASNASDGGVNDTLVQEEYRVVPTAENSRTTGRVSKREIERISRSLQ